MYCKVVKGVIFYEVVGEGQPLLILHSMGTDHRSMKLWIEPLFDDLEGYKRVYVDLPAHGRSKIDKCFKSSDDMLLNLNDFVEQFIGNQKFSILGFSYGGYIAQGVLHKRHQQIERICLLAPALHIQERSLPEKVISEKDEKALETLEQEVRIAFETLFTKQTKESVDKFLKEIQPGRLIADIDFLASDWRKKGYFFSEMPLQNVSLLNNKILTITGRNDSICGYKDHMFLINKFPNSSFVLLDNVGHMLHIEKRSLVKCLIKSWLN